MNGSPGPSALFNRPIRRRVGALFPLCVAAAEGPIPPVDTDSRPLNFRVVVPANWSRRGAPLGGGGRNGMMPRLNRGDLTAKGFATSGRGPSESSESSVRTAP